MESDKTGFQKWLSHLALSNIYKLWYFTFFLRFYLFLEKGEGKEGEKCQCVVASRAPPTGDLAHNPGMCPDWESNRRPFGLEAGTQSTESHQPGLWYFLSFSIWDVESNTYFEVVS